MPKRGNGPSGRGLGLALKTGQTLRQEPQLKMTPRIRRRPLAEKETPQLSDLECLEFSVRADDSCAMIRRSNWSP